MNIFSLILAGIFEMDSGEKEVLVVGYGSFYVFHLFFFSTKYEQSL